VRRVCVAVLLLGTLASGEEDAALTLAEARKTPPKDDASLRRVVTVLHSIGRHRTKGHAAILWMLASDDRQNERVRGWSILALGRVPDCPVEKVRALASKIVPDRKLDRRLRTQAASALGEARLADAASRALLEKVLLQPGDDSILQRTCLLALGKTAKWERIKALLLRRELYEHPYFGVRVDVCAGLANLDVRDRRSLEVLCALLTDDDEKDRQFLVSKQAWLGLWMLSGRVHGVADKDRFAERPAAITDEKDRRTYVWAILFGRAGVTPQMAGTVDKFVCSNAAAVKVAKRLGERIPRERNIEGLKKAAEAYRADIDAIVKEWGSGKGDGAPK